MSTTNKKDLSAHIGHDLECVEYGDNENVAVECIDCNEVLIDFDE